MKQQTRLWTRWTPIVILLILFGARDAAAACQNGSASQAVMAGENLEAIMQASTAPCTLNVSPGTYAAPATNFTISSGLVVRSTGGASVTTLQVAGSGSSVVSIVPTNTRCPTGATLEGFTLVGGAWGVFVGLANQQGCASNAIANVTLRNLTVRTSSTTDGHGINFVAVQNSVIDSCTVVNAFANGIFLEASHHNIVMNNTIANTQTQHAIAAQNSNDNVIVGNTVSASAFDGIIVNSSPELAGPGSSRNRIERNTIAGHKTDGILVNDASRFNYVGLNTAVSASYVPGSSAPTITTGVGIWVNNNSNANYLFGNDLSGSPENGIDILTSRSTFLVGNTVHGNYQGGIWVASAYFQSPSTAPVPQDTVLHGNNIFFNTYNAQINLQGVFTSDVAFNFLSGAQSGIVASQETGAIYVKDSGPVRVYENTMSEVSSRASVWGTTTAQFFRNRFLRGTNIPNPPQTDGRNGLTWWLAPAAVRWDAGRGLGGNHWSEFTAAAGNPDPTHPYTAFMNNTNGGPNVDRYPFRSETLQATTIPISVTVFEPIVGSVLAARTKKTVRWAARGCVLVDLSYASGAGSRTLIASGYPNTGYYFWDVPMLPVRADYSVEVACADSNGAPLGVSGNSPVFAIASSDLVLLNPGRGTRVTDGSLLRVAWKASAAVSGVNIFVKAGGGAETQVATNVTGTTFRDITLPVAVSSSSQVTIRIQDSGASARQDSVDGHFMVRGTSPSIGTISTGQALPIGSLKVLEWNGVSTSYTVDLDLVGPTSISIARNLPDFGSYTWLVPDARVTAAAVRATFRDAAGNAITSVDSATFSIGSNDAPSSTRGDLDGDGKTDLTVFRPSSNTWYVSYSSLGYAANDAFPWGRAGDLPVAADYDGDGLTDIAVFRPADGTWYIRYTVSGTTEGLRWGAAGDVPVPGDYNGDGQTDLAIFRPSTGTWWISFTGSTTAAFEWGLAGDVPVPGDYNGDGKTDLAIYRPSDGNWWIWYSGTSQIAALPWGAVGDVPVVGDFDGNLKTDLAVFRPSTGSWWIWYTDSTTAEYQWGIAGDVPVSGDFDGDGTTDLAIFRPSSGSWWIWHLAAGTTATFPWGISTDIPAKSERPEAITNQETRTGSK